MSGVGTDNVPGVITFPNQEYKYLKIHERNVIWHTIPKDTDMGSHTQVLFTLLDTLSNNNPSLFTLLDTLSNNNPVQYVLLDVCSSHSEVIT